MPASAYPSDIVFTPSVKALQQARGSRHAYARMEQGRGFRTGIDDGMRGFIEAQTTLFMATANLDGQPYIQHRGGPPGFLHVLDEHTIAFADFTGNRQFVSTGNLADNPKAQLFLMDYAHRQRLKIWGEARVETDPALVERLMPAGYKARAEQAIVFTVKAWDANCPQHIPQLVPVDEVVPAIVERDARIAALEKELAALRNSA
ncbi:pyridoxamine 5'-phosphate oxidase family protein [Scleromatobacter humisilvae]|uniref:Pyridoxamine 5'-phosphate oxidase family protein n=1 Tax=Scleromatobacter humisilvae TaxID=2897159 RepID=A0A9X1YFH1_9BURK|nr:pyridoxamine 5'-phosphate oxidase family protein [Scleromatobacter humisilvae]MCK9685088.1 pyridoxamine 5'-phosphate oxidase family protein [Scleromatobacter humisilvae]